MGKTNTIATKEMAYQEEAYTLQRECIEAIRTQKWDNIFHKTERHIRELELEQNKLSVFQHEQLKKAYYLGQIAAISQICQQTKKEKEVDAEVILVKKNSPLLDRCITFIGENQMVTCGQIVNGLELKHRSDFSNALNRQQKYGYIISYKMGNKNLYTLSGKGKKYYYDKLRLEERNIEAEKEIIIFINTLSDLTKNGEFNPIIITTEMARKRKSMKSFYLSNDFGSAMVELKKSYWSSVRLKIREMIAKNIMGNRISRIEDKEEYFYRDDSRNTEAISLAYTE